MSNPINSPIRQRQVELQADLQPTAVFTSDGVPAVATSASWVAYLGSDAYAVRWLFGADTRVIVRDDAEIVDGRIVWPAGPTPPAWFGVAVASALASAPVEAVTA